MNKPVSIAALFFLCAWSFASSAEPRKKGVLTDQKSGKRIALLVGINEYKDVGLSDLRKARNDAKGLAKILIQNGEFDSVVVMTDEIDPKQDPDSLFPTKLNIEEKLDSLLVEAGPDDVFLFFFSGHGVSDYEEKGFLLTQDTVLSKPFNSSLSVDLIAEKISKKGIKNSLLVLDACRDSMYTSKNASANSLLESGLSRSEIFAILYSTKAGFFSYEDDETSYGVFTKYLIYGLEGRADANRDTQVSFSELENYITAAVKDWSQRKNKQQKPYTKYIGEKSGDLILTYSTNPEVSLADVPVNQYARESIYVRSLLFPGWGQYYQGSEVKGKVYMGIAGVLLLATLDSYLKYQDAKKNYDSFVGLPPSTRFGESFVINSILLEPRERALNEARSNFETSSLLFGLFYFWNIADLALFPKVAEEPKQRFSFYMTREARSEIYPMALGNHRYEASYEIRF
ncbi:caspase domain protein [Leptospira ryugenii]|uniref:Caspase domain protein n=1 Tax=Leptospira ryugenii TaxID=1917863 RepID=A0A2P2E0S1_9LEPT|nr:caspase domain protein [Leptospira ryugenii]